MLILSRRAGQKLHIGDDVIITLVGIEGGSVRLAIDAPPTINIVRDEVIGKYTPEEIAEKRKSKRRQKPVSEEKQVQVGPVGTALFNLATGKKETK